MHMYMCMSCACLCVYGGAPEHHPSCKVAFSSPSHPLTPSPLHCFIPTSPHHHRNPPPQINTSRGEIAYNVVDLEEMVGAEGTEGAEAALAALHSLEGGAACLTCTPHAHTVHIPCMCMCVRGASLVEELPAPPTTTITTITTITHRDVAQMACTCHARCDTLATSEACVHKG